MVVSGTIIQLLTERVHWIARLSAQADGSWAGPIWYKNGNAASLPHTQVGNLETSDLAALSCKGEEQATVAGVPQRRASVLPHRAARIGIGEQAGDLVPFDAAEFSRELLAGA